MPRRNERRQQHQHASGLFRKACNVASRLGLYLLADHAGGQARWIVYSRRSGRELAVYLPQGRCLLVNDGRHPATNFRAALEAVAKLQSHQLAAS